MVKLLDEFFFLQIETYGSMEKKEKVELILEQMRYCLANKDYIRTQIISKKISIRFFEKVPFKFTSFDNLSYKKVQCAALIIKQF